MREPIEIEFVCRSVKYIHMFEAEGYFNKEDRYQVEVKLRQLNQADFPAIEDVLLALRSPDAREAFVPGKVYTLTLKEHTEGG